jgi:Resolvase, N terminal domain
VTVIGYARVSTTDQDLSIQEAALKAAGCQVIRAEKRSGTTTEGREALRTVLEFLHAGDVLMVPVILFRAEAQTLRWKEASGSCVGRTSKPAVAHGQGSPPREKTVPLPLVQKDR